MDDPARRSGLGLFAMAWAFLLPVAFSPSVAAPYWTPKAALLPVMAAVGVPLLPRLFRSTAKVPAICACLFAAVATASALLAPNRTTALFGMYIWGTGLIFVLALVGAWAVGVSLDARGRRDVERALLAGVLVNVSFAIVAMTIDLSAVQEMRGDGRAAGLLRNPLHLASMAAAAIVLLKPRLARGGLQWAPVVVACTAAVALSGSRMGIAAAVVLVAACAARVDKRAAVSLAVAAVVGLGLGEALARESGGTSVSSRFGNAVNGDAPAAVSAAVTGGTITPRIETWISARHAIAERPLLGIGPGDYRSATSPYRTLKLVRAEGPDRYFADAHNIVVEYATTTGILGVAALVAWVVAAGRRAQGPLAVFGLALVAMHVVSPQFVGTTPLAFLALGAGLPAAFSAQVQRRWTTIGRAVLATGGAALGIMLLIGDFHLNQARLDFSEAHGRAALRILPQWPVGPVQMSVIAAFEGIQGRPEKLADARAWQREAVRRDPRSAFLRNSAAGTALKLGDPTSARSGFEQALRLDPWSVKAMRGLGRIALGEGDKSQARHWLRRALLVQPENGTIRKLLEESEA